MIGAGLSSAIVTWIAVNRALTARLQDGGKVYGGTIPGLYKRNVLGPLVIVLIIISVLVLILL